MPLPHADLTFRSLASHEDRSVNHIADAPDGGMWESRFVQRTDDYFIVYLSSHTGCNKSCRFCHLTATGQTSMTPADPAVYFAQAEPCVHSYLDRLAAGQPPAQRVHFNFMARGEALANPSMLERSQEIYDGLGQMADALDLPAAFKVSTIIPADFSGDLTRVLGDTRSELYYSLYSMDGTFRKRWLPKAMDPNAALDRIAAYQQATGGRRVTLHWALIAGENDRDQDLDAIIAAVQARGLRAKFNLVRYNPHDARHGVESDEATRERYFARLSAALGEPGSRPVPRVGFDVKASCGMFVEPTD